MILLRMACKGACPRLVEGNVYKSLPCLKNGIVLGITIVFGSKNSVRLLLILEEGECLKVR